MIAYPQFAEVIGGLALQVVFGHGNQIVGRLLPGALLGDHQKQVGTVGHLHVQAVRREHLPEGRLVAPNCAQQRARFLRNRLHQERFEVGGHFQLQGAHVPGRLGGASGSSGCGSTTGFVAVSGFALGLRAPRIFFLLLI